VGLDSVQSATASAYVGVRPLSSAFPFNGQIDEPRIYNRALTTAEVAAIYDATKLSHGVLGPLVLHYEFASDETPEYIDSTLYGNDGTQATANARPTFVAAVGQTNSARYDFDGVDDYIDTQISRGSDFSGSFTITAWAKRDAAGSWHVVMSDQLVAIGNASFEMRFRDTDIPSFAMRDSIGTFTTVDGTSTVGADSWVHLAGVYDAGVQKLIYVDGALIASNAQTSVQSAQRAVRNGICVCRSAPALVGVPVQRAD